MTTALLALSVLVTSQDLKKPITYDCVANSVEKILADLSPQAGLRLRGSATTNPMLIMLHVEQAPLETVLKKLAEVTEAEWVREEGGMALSRTPAIQNRLDQEFFQRKLKNIEKALAKLKETNAKAPAFEGQTAENLAMRLSEVSKRQGGNAGEFDQGAYQTIEKIQREMPVGRSANRLAAMFDAKTLAALPKEGRTVFSTTPNKSQRPFPAGLQAEMNRLMQEQAILVEALKRHPLPKQDNGSYYMDRRSTQAMEMPSRVLAKVATFGGKSVSFEFIFVNSKNKSMTRTSTYMTPDGESRGDGDMEKIKAAGGGEKIEIDGDLKALCEALKPLYGGAMDGKTEVKLPQDLLQKVLNPEKFEPITFTAGPLMSLYAKAKKQNVIVSLNDTLVAFSTYLSFFGEPTTARLEAAFKSNFDIQEEGG